MASVRLTRKQCDNDDLPSICAKCGHDETQLVPRKFTWCPSWVIIFLFFGGLPILLLVYFLARKKMTVRVPLCDRHVNEWKWAGLFALVSLLGCVGLLIFGLVIQDERDLSEIGSGIAIFGGVGFFVCLIIYAVWGTKLIRPSEITKDDIRLLGVDSDFADAAEAMRPRRRAGDRDYDDYDDGPRRRKAPARDRYEDDELDDRPRRKTRPRDDDYDERRRD